MNSGPTNWDIGEAGQCPIKALQQRQHSRQREALELAAEEEKEGENRIDAEEQDRIERLVGNARNEQRREQRAADDERQVHPPVLLPRIEPIDQLGEFRPDERPAGADRATDLFGQAILAARSLPHRIDEQETNQRHGDEPQQIDARERQQGIEPAAEQVLPHPRDEPDRRGRRRHGPEQLGPRDGEIGGLVGHGLAFRRSMIFSENRHPLFGIMLYRSTRRTRAL